MAHYSTKPEPRYSTMLWYHEPKGMPLPPRNGNRPVASATVTLDPEKVAQAMVWANEIRDTLNQEAQ